MKYWKPIAGGARGLSTTLLLLILTFFSDGPSSDIFFCCILYLMSVSGLLYWNTSTSLFTLDIARRFVRDGPGTKKQIIGSVVLYVHEMSLRNTLGCSYYLCTSYSDVIAVLITNTQNIQCHNDKSCNRAGTVIKRALEPKVSSNAIVV